MLADEVSHLSTDTYGTVSYMAPELLGQGKFGKPADVYSFGLLSACRGRPELIKPMIGCWQRCKTGDLTCIYALSSSMVIQFPC